MATVAEPSLISKLRDTGAQVLDDDASLDFYAHDIYSRGADLAAIVCPANIAQLSAAIQTATNAGHAIVPRGGGMSYTGGYTQDKPGAVLFDLTTMDKILDINEDDMTVTVEAGCAWAKLYAALAPRGLRTPMWGTLSGLKASIGGAISQNGMFWGSGRHGSASLSCQALEVVLADGTVMRTGSDFSRPYGPDLTGLFCGDTGALGIKAIVTLRLIREAEHNAYASFVFDDHKSWLAASSEIERQEIATECFGFDPNLNALRMKRESLGADAKQLVGMMKSQANTNGGILKAIKEGAKVVAASRNFLKDAKFSLHVLAEGRIQAAADADIEMACEIVRQHGGREVENSIPKIVRANPFGPLNSMLGPDGERWAPIHGLLPHGKVQPCYDAIIALFDRHSAEMDRLGIHVGTLVGNVGGQGMIVEPCIYWPDSSNPLIRDTVEDAHLRRLPKLEANAESWDLAQTLKRELVDLFFEHKAVHFQIGRTYRYRDSLDQAADALLKSIKRQVDPKGLMNPGSLGL